MSSVRAAILIVFTLLGVGCGGSAKGPAFRPEVVEPTKAVIYIYRPPGTWSGRAVGVSIDQQPMGKLEGGQYLARQVEPGQRVVRVDGSSDAVRQVSLIAGDSAFLEVHASYWDERPTITLLDEQSARERIAHTGRAEAPR